MYHSPVSLAHFHRNLDLMAAPGTVHRQGHSDNEVESLQNEVKEVPFLAARNTAKRHH